MYEGLFISRVNIGMDETATFQQAFLPRRNCAVKEVILI